MKIQNMVKLFGIGVIALVMAGCESIVDGEIASVQIHGGVAGAPATMSLELGNIIGQNAFYNFFQHRAIEDEKLDINAVLDFAVTIAQKADCRQSGDTFVVVYDSEMNQLDNFKTCTENITVEFPADDIYIFQIQYPGNEGYFDADSTSS